MSSFISVFFLCAGLGSRLRPLTSRLPKPLIPFQGKSALEWNLEKVVNLSPGRILMNAHHLPEQIKAMALEWNAQVLLEPQILGTGGCLGNLENMLGESEYILVHNGDILHDIDLKKFIQRGLKSRAMGVLAGVSREAINTLCVSHGNLRGIAGYHGYIPNPDAIGLTYTGIALYHRSFLKFCQNKSGENTRADIKEYWVRALEAGETIGVENVSFCAWHDFGTPRDLWEAARWMMTTRRNFSYGYSSGNPEAKPWVANETLMTNLPGGLKQVLVLESPDQPLEPNASNIVVGKDFQWKI